MGRARLTAAFMAACLVAGNAAGQVSMGVARVPGVTVTRPPEMPVAAPQPMPPPSGALPGRHGPAPVHGGDLFRAGPHTYRPRPFTPHRFVWPYAYGPLWSFPYYPASSVDAAPSSAPDEIAGGYLRLEVEPRSAQVFVDGDFVGTVQDSGRRLFLDPGSHRVEVSADGFQTVTFDVRIRPFETITYRRDLDRAAGLAIGPVAPVTVTARAAAKTLYVIPRCYAGDKRPIAAALRAGCRIADLRVLTPTR